MTLSFLIWLPLAVGLLSAAAPRSFAPRLALLATVATFGITVGFAAGFDSASTGLQQLTDETWIAELGIHYKLGLDGLNVFLIALTGLTFFAATAAANLRPWERPRLFYFHLLFAETAVLGAFCAQDLALFVVFFDLMLIPFYFLTGIWGGRNRVAATTKLVIYTLVGSLLMLAAAVATGVLAAGADRPLSFALTDLSQQALPESTQRWIFLAFAAAFLVKMPTFPFQGWMPDGYRAMPIPVLMVFSAVLSKVAAYGFLRVVLPLFPDASATFQTPMLILALVSILYGSVMAFSQTDARLIVGYSSVAQLGFIVLGIFSLRPEGAQGALLQMVTHGLVVAPLLLLVALLAARAGGSEDIRDMGGVALRAPILAALFLIVAFANLAMPGTANFAGEFLILLGVFRADLVIALIASTGVVLAAVYMLRAFIAAMHGRPQQPDASREISVRDGMVLAPLVAIIVALSLYPQPVLDGQEKSARRSIRAAQAVADSGSAAARTSSEVSAALVPGRREPSSVGPP